MYEFFPGERFAYRNKVHNARWGIKFPFLSIQNTLCRSHAPPLKIVAPLSHIGNKNFYYFDFILKEREKSIMQTMKQTLFNGVLPCCFFWLFFCILGVFCGLAEEDFKNRYILLMYIFLKDTLDRTYIHRTIFTL